MGSMEVHPAYRMSGDDAMKPFHSFELLLLRRFQQQSSLWHEWCTNLQDLESTLTSADSAVQTLIGCLTESLKELGFVDMHRDVWTLSIAVHLLKFVKTEIQREKIKKLPKYGETLIMRYLNLYNFTVLNLDSMFKLGDDNRLPKEIFRCPNVKSLSLKYNSLDYLPCDIGRMSKLEYLALTNNKLSVTSLPYSLTFLKSLRTLFLDNNLLDALPGYLAAMPKLETVHRHGNHNYFKTTFMWYHTDVTDRVIRVSTEAQVYRHLESLQFWAAKEIIGQKTNFFQDHNVVPVLKDYISDIYHLFNICYHCNKACLSNTHGYKVITFKNPYLGNTCVPFQHWACSRECAHAVEIPARLEQISAAQKLDMQYENYVRECMRKFCAYRSPRNMLSLSTYDSQLYGCDITERDEKQIDVSLSSDESSLFNFDLIPQDRESKRGKPFSQKHYSGRKRRRKYGPPREHDFRLPSDSVRSKCSCVVS